MEPFFSCMKESKGLTPQTSASGSGATVKGTVVVSAVPRVRGASIVAEGSLLGATVCEAGVTLGFVSRGGLVICRLVSRGGANLRLKSGAGGCEGVTPEGPGDGVGLSGKS